ncbi:hypothetical protein Ahy_A10g048935 [Arachis hypogaea]|uniref:Anoctamin transmembrane domain-containing protein n=1 Tax=Arachis hypogaea TaxID=3818 RepID=A0A445B686_ARAHY|nr:hypothetical protein Ahy_A10g048935 [Arachis hypogaea]
MNEYFISKPCSSCYKSLYLVFNFISHREKIFSVLQFLILISICTNCALLAWLFDEEGKWKIEPGLVVILIMEHALLLIKFSFSRLVPLEPAWVRAARAKNSSQARDMYTKRLFRTID